MVTLLGVTWSQHVLSWKIEKRAASSPSVLALQRVVTGEGKGRIASAAQSQRRRPVTDEQPPQARLCLRRSRLPDRPRAPTQSVEECNCRHVRVRNFNKMRQNGEKSRLRKVFHPTGWVLQVKARQSRGARVVCLTLVSNGFCAFVGRFATQEDRRGKVTALRCTALRTGPLTLSSLTQPVLEALAGVNSKPSAV